MVTFISIVNIINNLWPKSFTVNGPKSDLFHLKESCLLFSMKSDVNIKSLMMCWCCDIERGNFDTET